LVDSDAAAADRAVLASRRVVHRASDGRQGRVEPVPGRVRPAAGGKAGHGDEEREPRVFQFLNFHRLSPLSAPAPLLTGLSLRVSRMIYVRSNPRATGRPSEVA